MPMQACTSGLSRSLIMGLAGACVAIVLAVGAVRGQSPPQSGIGVLTPDAGPGYAGSASCANCHPAQTSAWRASQHARAMQTATPDTVLGDFNDQTAAHFESRARFVRKDGRYVVETEGRDGKQAEFKIDYTFGLEPLQQYLTTFPDGRVQPLPFAWVTTPKEAGGQRWTHLYPDEAIPAGDPLHWTRNEQNWNFMCADCHSTAVRKNYDARTNRFATSFSEISVGCEACHGKAAGHVAWAAGGRPANIANKGFASLAKRPAPDWTPDPATGSPAHGVARPVGDEVETCGTCHARRGQFAEGWQPGKPLADFYRPAFLTPDLFEDDGQMRGEVFNYASFQQSKMHAKGVVCSDCHEPHSGKLKAAGSEVCAQCHATQTFASKAHTGHEPQSGAPDCISCHMPSRVYMVVDKRHDHSFRIPRPDLSATLGTPNTCNACHRDKEPAWAAAAVERWRGPDRKGFQTYARAFHAARNDLPDARELLLAVVRDAQTPAIARATALFFLRDRPSAAVDGAVAAGLSDPDPLVRVAALEGLWRLAPDARWRRAAPLLSDPVRLVRIQAANVLAEGPPADASDAEKQAFAQATSDYVASEEYTADRPESRANLAQFMIRQGRTQEAEKELLGALDLQYALAPRLALADLYRATGRESDAQLLLQQTISIDPKSAEARHALGLALVRAKRLGEALEQLRQAHELAPNNARFAYVYAVALDAGGRRDEAAAVLRQTLEVSPSNTDVLSMLVQDAMRRRDLKGALAYGERLQTLMPENVGLRQFLSQIRSATTAQ